MGSLKALAGNFTYKCDPIANFKSVAFSDESPRSYDPRISVLKKTK